MVQSMVPEVSLFFGDGDSSAYVPAVQHPQKGPSEPQHPAPSSTGPRMTAFSSVTPKSIANVQNSISQKSATAMNYVSNMTPSQSESLSTQTVHTTSAQNKPVPTHPGLPVSAQSDCARSSQDLNLPSQHTVRPPVPHPYPTSSSSVPHSFPASCARNSYPFHPNTQGPRPGFCTCPNCPRPPTQPYDIPQSYDQPRGPYPPRPVYHNYGPPPPRLQQPPNPQPMVSNHPQSYPQSLPASSNYPYQQLPNSYQANYPNMPGAPENQGYPYHPSSGQQNHQYDNQAAPCLPISSASQGTNNSLQGQAPIIQGSVSYPQIRAAPQPQASGGLPKQSESYTSAQRTPVQSNEFPRGVAEVRRSNQNSDNSGRSSDDSGLSFTPEKHNSPATVSPKSAQNPTSPLQEAGATQMPLPSKGLNWENVPPEIYQLLLQQDQQLKELQAQIKLLTAQQAAQSLNNSAESGVEATNTMTRSPNPPNIERCTTATNTSECFPDRKEQVSECIQTSLQKQNYIQQNTNVSQSSSSGSGCETRTPLEIRHRGRLPMNSTQRDDAELDISQGELVALVNNMHDRTIDSVQSDMIVDLPSFQSSPTRLVFTFFCLC